MMKTENKKVKHCISLSPEDSELLKDYAKACGITQSKYIAIILKRKAPMPLPNERFWEYMNLLYTILDSITEGANGNTEILSACKDLDKWVLDFQREMLVPKEVA